MTEGIREETDVCDKIKGYMQSTNHQGAELSVTIGEVSLCTVVIG